MDPSSTDGQFDLVDLTGVSLADLSELEDTVFAHSLQRVLTEIDHPEAAVAKWNSAM